MSHNQSTVEKIATRAGIGVSDPFYDRITDEWSVTLYAPALKRLSAYETHQVLVVESTRTELWEEAASIIAAGLEDCRIAKSCDICQYDIAEHEYDMER